MEWLWNIFYQVLSWIGVLLLSLLGLIAAAIVAIFAAIYALLAAIVGVLVLGVMKLIEILF